MLFDPERHEPLQISTWDPGRVRDEISRIAQRTCSHLAQNGPWPTHPLDDPTLQPDYTLYGGACGVIWALHALQRQGAVELPAGWQPEVLPFLAPNRTANGEAAQRPFASYLLGDTSLLMLDFALTGRAESADELARLVSANIDHPARELMFGSPGTLTAALFMHQRTGEARWADLFVATAQKLWSQLEHSAAHDCQFWTQEMGGSRSDYIDAVHGFVGTATPLIRGRSLIPGDWPAWQACIENTVRRTARWEDGLVNWPPLLSGQKHDKRLVQYCHGSPGFVICLGGLPGDGLDDLLAAGAALVWQAGPLRKGSNLCHGTAGNGYAFLKMFQRTSDTLWLDRARAFAMHAIAQCEQAFQEYDEARFSLWTGDPGLAIYLWNCIEGTALFPTVDYFFPD